MINKMKLRGVSALDFTKWAELVQAALVLGQGREKEKYDSLDPAE